MVSDEASSSAGVTPMMSLLLEAKHQKYMKHVNSSLAEYKSYDSWLDNKLLQSEKEELVGDNDETYSRERFSNDYEVMPELLVSDLVQPSTT